jgi:uncharacterized protein (TIGR02996 family)
MSARVTDAGREAAIAAQPEEGAPRLALAEWLDEHGDPDRAEFARAQCRRADMPPSESDWIGLRERQHRLGT